MNELFAGLIASKTMIKLWTQFFFNPETRSYLRELTKRLRSQRIQYAKRLINSPKQDYLNPRKTAERFSTEQTRKIFFLAKLKNPVFIHFDDPATLLYRPECSTWESIWNGSRLRYSHAKSASNDEFRKSKR